MDSSNNPHPVEAGDTADPAGIEVSPPPGPNKVEIHVGGHIVVVESTESLADVAGTALSLHEQTAGAAVRLPMGFTAGAGQFERAGTYSEPGWVNPEEDADAR